MSAPAPSSLGDQLRRLRLEGKLAQARDLIRARPGFATSAPLQRLLYEHEDFWWEPILGKRVTLRRRGPEDASFVRACWRDADFMRKFNRHAQPLPNEDAELRQILARERAGILGESKALHWTIENKSEPIGFVSATEYWAKHRRCEFLVGVPQPRDAGLASGWLPVEAARLATDFLKDKAGVERLTAYFYAENGYAAKVARKFGFEPEGVLKEYLRDDDGQRSDLLVSGMLLRDSQAEV